MQTLVSWLQRRKNTDSRQICLSFFFSDLFFVWLFVSLWRRQCFSFVCQKMLKDRVQAINLDVNTITGVQNLSWFTLTTLIHLVKKLLCDNKRIIVAIFYPAKILLDTTFFWEPGVKFIFEGASWPDLYIFMTICSLYNKDYHHSDSLMSSVFFFHHVLEVIHAIFVKYFCLPVKSKDLLFVKFPGSRLEAAHHLVSVLHWFVEVKSLAPTVFLVRGNFSHNLLILSTVVWWYVLFWICPEVIFIYSFDSLSFLLSNKTDEQVQAIFIFLVWTIAKLHLSFVQE